MEKTEKFQKGSLVFLDGAIYRIGEPCDNDTDLEIIRVGTDVSKTVKKIEVSTTFNGRTISRTPYKKGFRGENLPEITVEFSQQIPNHGVVCGFCRNEKGILIQRQKGSCRPFSMTEVKKMLG